MVTSPCINVCRMENGLCAGCHRTLDEIARWGNASELEKRCVLAAIAQRQATTSSDTTAPRRAGDR